MEWGSGIASLVHRGGALTLIQWSVGIMPDCLLATVFVCFFKFVFISFVLDSFVQQCKL